MGNFNAVEAVTVIVELEDGTEYKVRAASPGPTGSNPRFMTQQLHNGLKGLTDRLDAILAASPHEQYPPNMVWTFEVADPPAPLKSGGRQGQ